MDRAKELLKSKAGRGVRPETDAGPKPVTKNTVPISSAPRSRDAQAITRPQQDGKR
jgi:hypothetical protein